MIIKNIKTGKIEEDITHEMWDKLKARHISGKYTVIDDTDITVTTEKVVMPTDVKEILKSKKVFLEDIKKIEKTVEQLDYPTEEIDIPEVDKMKEELKDAGIRVHPNTGDEKVKEKYDKFKEKK